MFVNSEGYATSFFHESRDGSRKPVEFFGKEATTFLVGLVEGQEVTLAFDSSGSSKDRYGRTLAYLHLLDGTDVNLEIIRRGFGHAYVKYPFSRMSEYTAAEKDSRERGMGLWGER